jgi:phenylpropionate dioxygenase-like ring-hydroxylating dioxygenase large terminal subunit
MPNPLNDTERNPPANLRRGRRREPPLPTEGEGGFSQCWYPVCLSSEVEAGKVLGVDFLDGRIVVMRGADGVAQVLSAYCPHMGADMSCGHVEGDALVCAFHFWRFGRDGRCTGTMVGDPVPARAQLFRFPTLDRYGLIWAFNGETPLYDLPDFTRPDRDLIWRAERHWLLPCDPGCLVPNSLDVQHVIGVHGFDLDHPAHFDAIDWGRFEVRSTVSAHVRDTGMPLEWDVSIFGTNLVRVTGRLGAHWHGTWSVFGIPVPGYAQTYFIAAVDAADGTHADGRAAREYLDFVAGFQRTETEKDSRIMNRIRFVQGTLTQTDRAVAHLLKHFRGYPRAHPGADYIA